MKSSFYLCTLFLFLSLALPAQSRFPSAHPGLEARATGTGRTTGHVITLTLLNTTGEEMDTEIGPLVIPSEGEYQGYVINDVYPVTIPAFGYVVLPVDGYCTDYSKLELPAGSMVFNSENWVEVDAPFSVHGPEVNLVAMGFEPYSIMDETEMVLTYPGTNITFSYRVDIDEYLLRTGTLLVDAVNRIESAYDRWIETEHTNTVLEVMEAREMRNTVVQHVFWYYTSILRGEPYNREYLTEVVTQETELVVNTSSQNYTQAAITQVQEETQNVWDVLVLIGSDAKILKEPDAVEDTWGIHYQRWVQTTLRETNPNQLSAGGELVFLDDTLSQIRDYLGDLFIERIRNGISVKLGDYFKFQLGKLKDYDQLSDWVYLDEIVHSKVFELLEPATQSVIREELDKRMDRWIREQLDNLQADDIKGWVELEALVGWDAINASLQPATQALLRERLGEFFYNYALQQALLLNPSDPNAIRSWMELEILIACPWYDAYVSPDDQGEIKGALSKKFTSFLNTQLDQLDPKDTSMIRKWSELEVLILSDWFTTYVSESDQTTIIKKLSEKFTSYLNEQLEQLNPADTSMLVKWQQTEILILSDWFTTYVSESDQTTIIRKLSEKFTQFMKTQAGNLDPADEGMLKKWAQLETLTHSDWFEKYISEADRQEIIKKLKVKFTAWLKEQISKLDPKDPKFLEKWMKLEKLTLSDWFDEYVDKPKKAGDDLSKEYQQWGKANTEPVDYSQVQWQEVQWTGERIKVLFGGPLPAVVDKTGLSPVTWTIIAGVPIATGIIVYVLTRPDPAAASPDVLTIACPGEGTVNVLANDVGKDLKITSVSQSPYAAITDAGNGNLFVELFLTEPITQFSFSYTIEDRKGRSSTADVLVNVTLPPINAVDDVFEGYTSTPLAGNPLINDIGEGLVVLDNTIPQGGAFNMGFDGTFTFVPDGGFCDNTSFSYTVLDECGQTASANVSINLQDTEAPAVTCPPDLTVSCENPTDPGATGQATATDNCTLNPTLTYVDEYSGVPCNQVLTRTWTATDEVGLSASCVQVVTIVDETAPAVTCPPDSSIPCEDMPDPTVTGGPEYTDNCTLTIDLVVIFEDQFTGTGGSGDLERTWKVVDQCGNMGSCIQVIKLVDEEAPVITCPPDIQITCELPPDPGTTGYPEVSDNCAATAEIEVQFEDVFLGSGCLPDIQRTWTAKDGAGNVASCEHLIVIEDMSPPMVICPPDITVDCGQQLDLNVCGMAVGIDDCGGVTLVYTDDQSGLSGCSGVVIRNWVAFDDCGNAAFCTQTITIVPVDCAFEPNINLLPSTCGQPNGEIALSMNPSGEYSFTWSDGTAGPVISNLFSGLYAVTITDEINFCTEVVQIFLPEAPPVFVLNTTVDPDLCIIPGNITLLLDNSGSGLFNIFVTGPNSFSIPPQPPGEVVLGAFGALPPGNYTVFISDPEGPPGCEQVISALIPYIPPYTLSVVNVVQPSSPSASDGEVTLSVSGAPLFPLNVLVNGVLAGQANSTVFSVTGLPAGTYDFLIIDAEGGGCASNTVTITLEFMPPGNGPEIQLLTQTNGPIWPQWALEALPDDPGMFIPEHPVLEPGEPEVGLQSVPIAFGMGYGLTGRLQIQWGLGYSQGQLTQSWLDPASGASYRLESTMQGLSSEGGFRYYAPPGRATAFLGAGLTWQHLSFANTRLTGAGQSYALDPLPTVDRFSTYLTAGMRWNLGQRVFIEMEGRMTPPMGWGQTPEFYLRPGVVFRL
ncbi:MAG: hypothetical protein H6563_08925 [Lewinellaceae bacterium]|nr:hypothetical protein [Lewinellaceae bacterium]